MIRRMRILAWLLAGALMFSAPYETRAEWYNPLSWTSSSKKSSNKEGTFSKVTNGTKDFFNKTADYLNPFNDANDKPKKKKTRFGGSTFRSSKKQEEPSAWDIGSWFTSDEPGTAQTVSDFMDMDRPNF